MKTGHSHQRTTRGFTLVETLIVIVVLSIASIAIAALSSNLFRGQAANRNIVVGTQLMQECAEKLLAARRSNGFKAAVLASNAAATTFCKDITQTGFNAPEVELTKGNSSNISACPSATVDSCKLVTITQGGLTPVVFLLVDYN